MVKSDHRAPNSLDTHHWDFEFWSIQRGSHNGSVGKDEGSAFWHRTDPVLQWAVILVCEESFWVSTKCYPILQFWYLKIREILSSNVGLSLSLSLSLHPIRKTAGDDGTRPRRWSWCRSNDWSEIAVHSQGHWFPKVGGIWFSVFLSWGHMANGWNVTVGTVIGKIRSKRYYTYPFLQQSISVPRDWRLGKIMCRLRLKVGRLNTIHFVSLIRNAQRRELIITVVPTGRKSGLFVHRSLADPEVRIVRYCTTLVDPVAPRNLPRMQNSGGYAYSIELVQLGGLRLSRY